MIQVTKSDNPTLPGGREVKILCTDCGFYQLPLSTPGRRFRAEHYSRGCKRDGEVIEGSIDR